MKINEITEAPLGDYELVGNWGDKEKSHGFRHAKDRKILQNPTAVRLARKKFGNTEHNLNFYFVNLPGASKHSESGFMETDKVKAEFPDAWNDIAKRANTANHDDAINVIFVGNTGANRKNMTPWIMAHRIGHAIQSSVRGSDSSISYAWKDYERDFVDQFHDILNNTYGWNLSRDPMRFFFGDHTTTLTKFFEAVGGMRSARKSDMGGRPYEFVYELFAQHIVTGQMTFRDLPQSFGLRNGRHYQIQEKSYAEMYNRDLNEWISDQLGSYVDNCLYAATGKWIIM